MSIKQPAPVGAVPSSVKGKDFAVVGGLAQRFTLPDGGCGGAVAEAVMAPRVIVQREGARCVRARQRVALFSKDGHACTAWRPWILARHRARCPLVVSVIIIILATAQWRYTDILVRLVVWA